jgi:superfamily II DNA or RNA helicase
MGLEIIARKQQPALIIFHRRQLFDQWVDRIQSFLSIPKFQIGRIESGYYEIGEGITVAMIQSLQTPNLSDKDKLYHAFGTIIVDECHHIPAKIAIALEKFTIPDAKYLGIQVMENNGGRHLLMKLQSKHLLKANMLPDLR